MLQWQEPLFANWRRCTQIGMFVRLTICLTLTAFIWCAPYRAENAVEWLFEFIFIRLYLPLWIFGTVLPTHRKVTVSNGGVSCQLLFFSPEWSSPLSFCGYGIENWGRQELASVDLRQREKYGNDGWSLIIHPKHGHTAEIAVPQTVSPEVVATEMRNAGLSFHAPGGGLQFPRFW